QRLGRPCKASRRSRSRQGDGFQASLHSLTFQITKRIVLMGLRPSLLLLSFELISFKRHDSFDWRGSHDVAEAPNLNIGGPGQRREMDNVFDWIANINHKRRVSYAYAG